MHRQRVESEALNREEITLGGEEARHLATVLRVREGARVMCFDGRGKTRPYTVARAEKRAVDLVAAGSVDHAPQPEPAITLFACVTKGDRWDWLLEKATELGAAAIAPVISERTIVRLDAREAAAKRIRWQRIVEEAARQCGAAWVPEVAVPVPLRVAAAARAGAKDLVAALLPEAKPLKSVLMQMEGAWPKSIGWWSGPEGDFTEEELALLLAGGAIPVNLGEKVLRAETAALYGLAVVNCLTQKESA